MDTISKEKRSILMSRIRSKGNRSTEKRLRSALMRAKIKGWRMHAMDLPGHPDFVFDSPKLIVFADGCFWHGCPKCYRRPNSAQQYWDEKVRLNKKRDRTARNRLRKRGWSVIKVWEHELHTGCATKRVIAKVLAKITRRKFQSHSS